MNETKKNKERINKKFFDDHAILENEHHSFILDEKGCFLVIGGIKRQITRGVIISNGPQDLCVYQEENGDLKVKETVKVDKNRILSIPTYDILWLNFSEPIGNMRSVIIEIDDNTKKVVDEMVRRFPTRIGPDYAIYGGGSYGGL